MKAVVDASVILAMIFEEPGSEQLEEAIADGSVVSDVSRAEIIRRMMRSGTAPQAALLAVNALALESIPFASQFLPAMTAIFPHAKRANLSLADCACLATARYLGLPSLTADRAWAEIAGDVGVEVVVVR